MLYKLLSIFAYVCIASARYAPYGYNDQIVGGSEKQHIIDYEEDHPVDYRAPAKYRYSYGVEDFKTGDFKTHKEERDGDVVKGEYTVADPDGTLRTVTYTVDKHSGFKAVVTRSGNEHFKAEDYAPPQPAPKPTQYPNLNLHEYDRDEPYQIQRSSNAPYRSIRPYRREVEIEKQQNLPRFYYRDNNKRY